MSVHKYPDEFEAPEIQIWNNAAFDNGEIEEDPRAFKVSFSDLRSDSDSVSQSFESDWSKENQNPVMVDSISSVSLKSAASITNQVHSIKTLGNTTKGGFNAFPGKSKVKQERNIDGEIEEIEKEIKRLTVKLESLRLEKAEQTARSLTVRGRTVQAKFMEQKPIKIEDSSSHLSAKPKINRRGMSLGPSEIFSASKTGTGKITPLLHPSRRKSCFWKLQDIDEDKVTNEGGSRRITLSLSPKSRKAASKIQPRKQAATTVGSKRAVKKDEGILSTIQPKTLFKDGEKSAKLAKKPLKSGRIVASRYSMINNNNIQTAEKDVRKRSLPENDKEEGNRCEKRRASDENTNQKNESSRVKKKWELPSEVVMYKSEMKMDGEIGNQLQKIRTFRCIAESPRDSGPAKRVAELVGRSSIFSSDEDSSVCQSLSFDAEDGED